MKPGGKILACALGSLALTLAVRGADIPVEYGAILERNVFDLKEPPPPPKNTPDVVIPPPANVKLVGILTIFGPPQGLFSIQEPPAPGKPPPTPTTFIMSDGDVQGGLQVIKINLETRTASIKNDGNVAEIHIEEPAKGAPVGGPIAGGPGMGMPGGFGAATALGRPGGLPQPGMPTPTYQNPALAAAAAAGSVPGGYNPNGISGLVPPAGASGLLARPVRTGLQLTPEQSQVLIEAQREQAKRTGDPIATILPPTALGAALQSEGQPSAVPPPPNPNGTPAGLQPRATGTLR